MTRYRPAADTRKLPSCASFSRVGAPDRGRRIGGSEQVDSSTKTRVRKIRGFAMSRLVSALCIKGDGTEVKSLLRLPWVACRSLAGEGCACRLEWTPGCGFGVTSGGNTASELALGATGAARAWPRPVLGGAGTGGCGCWGGVWEARHGARTTRHSGDKAEHGAAMDEFPHFFYKLMGRPDGLSFCIHTPRGDRLYGRCA